MDINTAQVPEYLHEHQAAAYICVDENFFNSLITSGALDGTYVSYEMAGKTIDGRVITLNVFSKSKLDEWMAKRCEEPGLLR